jgi:hypothetical protein
MNGPSQRSSPAAKPPGLLFSGKGIGTEVAAAEYRGWSGRGAKRRGETRKGEAKPE